MTTDTREVETVLEGTWEEILAHADALKGRRVEVKVFQAPTEETDGAEEQRRRSLVAADRFRRRDFPPEERAALDEMDEFLNTHRLSFRPPAYFDAEEEKAAP